MAIELYMIQNRLEIGDIVTRYAFAVDQRDWTAFDDIFDDEVCLVVPHVPQDRPVMRQSELVQLIREAVSGFAATRHPVANQLVAVDGDTGTCKAYRNAWHTLPTDQGIADYCLVRGQYDWKLIRTKTGWRISEMVITFTHAERYMGLYELAKTSGEAAITE